MTSFSLSGGGWSHDVVVGSIASASSRILDLTGGQTVPLVTDERVQTLHLASLEGIADFHMITVPEGEAAKDWTTLRRLLERFAELNINRRTPILAFGGGSVGDVAGLAASLFKRGCPVVHIPTTLLAQVDSAIGGKTAIDACGQKNLVGTYHPPALVICDPAFLATLEPRQLRAGYAEVVKYGLIDDPEFFRWCEDNVQRLLGGDREAQTFAIHHCLRAKARLIGDDLRDLAGKRALLNLGHSFGHAIESLCGLDRLLHGEAVAVGMSMAFRLSYGLGYCPGEDVQRLRQHLSNAGLPVDLAGIGLAGRGAELLPFLRQDKKAQSTGLVLILAGGIGKAFVAGDVPEDRLAEFLARPD